MAPSFLSELIAKTSETDDSPGNMVAPTLPKTGSLKRMSRHDSVTRLHATREENQKMQGGFDTPVQGENNKENASKLINIRELLEQRNGKAGDPESVLKELLANRTSAPHNSTTTNAKYALNDAAVQSRQQSPEMPESPQKQPLSPSKKTRPERKTALIAPSTSNAMSKNNAVAELLARRNQAHGGGDVDSKKSELVAMLAKRSAVETSSEDQKKNQAIADILAKRNTQPKPAEDNQRRNNAVANMLAKRTGGIQDTKKNAIADMLSKRANPSTPETPAAESRGNALAEMLAKRNPPAEESAPAPKQNALAAMLAKRAAPAGESRGNPLADMLAKRNGPPKSDDSSSGSKMNPLAAMLAKRQGSAPAPAAEPVAEVKKEEPADEHANTPLKDHPKYSSYFKMLKIGHPAEVVKHRMRREGADPLVLEQDPNKPLQKVASDAAESDENDPEYQAAMKLYNQKFPKYQQMMKMGLPRGAVEHKMQMEGIDPAWLDGPPKPKKKAAPRGPTEEEIAAHQKKYEKYFQMLKMGLPRGAVEHKMRMSGIDPRELDGPIMPGGDAPAAAGAGRPGLPPPPKKPSSIRKKLHWEVKRQEARDVNRESLWNVTLMEDSTVPVKISDESKEMLEKLFVKDVTTKPAAATKAKGDGKAGAKDKAEKKQVMYLIDMKKSQNIAITLARIKQSFPELKREILALNPMVLSTAQLQSLMDMWPDQQEQVTIDNFHGDMSLIGAAEKFLVEVRNIPRFREKMGCLVFKQEFPNRVHELRESVNLVIRGVNQVCSSSALRQLFIYILQTGNLLNFGSDDDRAAMIGGFSLNSLVKLSQTKAFTGGITLLQYIVQSIDRDIPQLTRFPQQINLIQKCSKVSISSLFSEKRALDDGLKSLIHESQAVVPAEGDADAELAASILKHFAAEVERELTDLQSLLDRLMDSKSNFLEYFEEDDTSEELDTLLTHIANFSREFEREHDKYLEVKKKKELQEKQKQEREKQEKLRQERSQSAKSISLHHKTPLHTRARHLHAVPHARSRPRASSEERKSKEEAPEEKSGKARPSSQQYFPGFVVDHLKRSSSGFTRDSLTSESTRGEASSPSATVSA
ncbi:hypothetical protein Poli38472_014034 [Pythium oligandrum]|uniref:FH2 domain-containing protein n=1 Tax=Pythium oligandrum TaxID=41045 RepID=A0A8K1FPA5_PYTOL|nr:hypothetical protein Poli38472_014034 [Pythium oligandrum]|eukprot:TMW66722.1 hypothetical protein Poli38472_014034 [Pythium oligandrum]